ncbi:MAG: UDP-N-acetylglucosamine 1-carboxyvinyltransferase [Kiritimatiellae bacterium]|nr:UDP-N-acetylglucosamine 1-carboxyvinyltransferase [Kiritimatiellia bacterium]
MQKLVIHGGKTLSGEIAVSGNKNAVLPMIAASLLSPEKTVLANVPDIADVSAMLEAARSFGAKVVRDVSAGRVEIETPRLRSSRIDAALASATRTSFLFAGPLLARAGRASLPPPGGDSIGMRRLDTHFAGFKALGAKTVAGRKTLRLRGALKGARMLLDEASVTATENILMASVLAPGRTEIYNAACEPHVSDLAAMLNSMGAKVSGAGTNRICVEGVERLHGCEARVGCDYIEAGSYIAAAAVTGGELLLKGIDPAPFEIMEGAFRRFGITWSIDSKAMTLRYVPKKRLKMRYDLGDAIPSLSDGPWPAFPSDMLSVLVVVATQTRGTCLFFEKMFESRLYFIDRLRQMGAKIVQCDPHRVVVTGPSQLYGGRFSSPDIRAGIAMVIAALAAKGESVILNAETIDRGYAGVEKNLARLGANISRQ